MENICNVIEFVKTQFNVNADEPISTYNITNQSPVVAPVDACVKCSKFSSVKSCTAGVRFSCNFWKISSPLADPSYKSGVPLRKNTIAGSFVGLYKRAN